MDTYTPATPEQRKHQDAELSALIFDPTLTRTQAFTILAIMGPGELDPEEVATLTTKASGADLASDLGKFDGRPEPTLAGL